MAYNELVEKDRQSFVGKNVIYKGGPYKVVDVDYNGALLIDLRAQFTETIAVSRFDENLQIL